MYQLDTFHLHKNEGASEWVGGWVVYPKNYQKMSSN